MEVSQNKISFSDNLIGAGAGFGVYKFAPGIIQKPIGKRLFTILSKNKPLSQEETAYHNALKTIFYQKEFNNKAGINYLNANNIQVFLKALKKLADNTPGVNRLPKFMRYKSCEKAVKLLNKGVGGYIFAAKYIILPEKNSLAAFHEIGHLLNKHQKGLWNKMRKSRIFSLIAPPIIIGIALLTPKKSSDNKKIKTSLSSAADFIKENAGKLTLLSSLPLIIEEVVATHKGEKLAAKYLKPELLPKIKLTNRIGCYSYILAEVIFSLTLALGVKTGDFISEKLSQIRNH